MLLIFMLKLQELMERSDNATANDRYEEEEQIAKEIEVLRDAFHVDFAREYGFSFSNFEETVNLSYDYVC